MSSLDDGEEEEEDEKEEEGQERKKRRNRRRRKRNSRKRRGEEIGRGKEGVEIEFFWQILLLTGSSFWGRRRRQKTSGVSDMH